MILEYSNRLFMIKKNRRMYVAPILLVSPGPHGAVERRGAGGRGREEDNT